MKRLLNMGMSDPLTLGMAHPIADRLESLGRARPASKRARATAFGLTGLVAMMTAPLTVAADKAPTMTGYTLTVFPDRTPAQLEELKSRMDAVYAGHSDHSVVTEFLRENRENLQVSYDLNNKQTKLVYSIGLPATVAALPYLEDLLKRCKAEKTSQTHVMRTTLDSGGASVECFATYVSPLTLKE